MAYRNITPYQILEHLNNRWCPLDAKAKKELKKAYYTKWDHAVKHLTAFGKHLDDDQCSLVRSDVTIADDDKLQFYLEEIYDSNRFNKQEMLTWEREPATTKTDFDLAKTAFRNNHQRHQHLQTKCRRGNSRTQPVRISQSNGRLR